MIETRLSGALIRAKAAVYFTAAAGAAAGSEAARTNVPGGIRMKFSGEAGFRLKDVEVEPDVFEPKLVSKIIKGGCRSDRYGRQNGDKSTIDNITITNQLSIVANQFLMKHIANLLYVKFQGVKWKVVSYNIKAPRIFCGF